MSWRVGIKRKERRLMRRGGRERTNENGRKGSAGNRQRRRLGRRLRQLARRQHPSQQLGLILGQALVQVQVLV